MNTEPTIISEWRKNAREMARVSLDQYQGRDTIDIRSWWLDAIATALGLQAGT